MEIINLEKQYEHTYCKCLEDWSEEMREAGNYKEQWLEKKKQLENSPIKGRDLYYIYCIWVHGYKQGVGNYQKKGIGKMLLEAAEKDCKESGAKGIAAWGITLPFFMQSRWFKKHGYKKADRDGMFELVWKPFTDDVEPPQLSKMIKKPQAEKGFVTVTCFRNGWCPAQNLSCERMKKAVDENQNKDKIKLIEIDTDIQENLLEWGISDGIFIDDKQINTGPPPSFKKLQSLLNQKVKNRKLF